MERSDIPWTHLHRSELPAGQIAYANLPQGQHLWYFHYPGRTRRFPLVKDIVLPECQLLLTLSFFVSINFADKVVVNLYFLFTKAVIVFDCFMDYDFINHVVL